MLHCCNHLRPTHVFHTMATSSNFMSTIEKLDGRDNFSTWKFAVQSYLEHEGLWKCVLGEDNDPVNNTKARTKIVLLVKPINFVHIQQCKTAKELWDKLIATFADTGLMRRVSLIKTLITTRLENSNGIEEYVNTIITAADKLDGIGCKVDDVWIGSFLLAGLPDMYQPMIMAIESSGVNITSDFIKSKLLQEVKNSDHSSLSAALHVSRRGPRCYECNDFGHIAVNCRKKKPSPRDSVSANRAEDNVRSSFASGPKFATGFFVHALRTGQINDCEKDSGASVNQCLVNQSPRKQAAVNYDFVYVDDILSVKQDSNSESDVDQSLNLNLQRFGMDRDNLNLNSCGGASEVDLNLNSVVDQSRSLKLNSGGDTVSERDLILSSGDDQSRLLHLERVEATISWLCNHSEEDVGNQFEGF